MEQWQSSSEYEKIIEKELEQFKKHKWAYFIEEAIDLLEEKALEFEKEFDRDKAIEHFETIELQELLKKEKKKIEYRCKKMIESEIEKEWEIEKYTIRQSHFEIGD